MSQIDFDSLKERDCIQDVTNWDALCALTPGTPFYWGLDPTAPSLQIGNFAGVIALAQLSSLGLRPIVLFGGATGAIGDPSGRNAERSGLLEQHVIEANIARQAQQLQAIFDRLNLPKIETVNNYDWTQGLSVLEFLRSVGKYITVGYMCQKESIRNRLEGDGISFTEFSYMLLQALDFRHLYTTKGVKLQIGGSDQWGNITSGIELVRKSLGEEVYGLSFPLIVDKNGKKFGKSVGQAVWLDQDMCSPYKLHQFLLNVGDDEVDLLLRRLTLLPLEELQRITEESLLHPEMRIRQRHLADWIVRVVHGEDALLKAQKAAHVLFGGDLSDLTGAQIREIFSEVPSSSKPLEYFATQSLVDAFVDAGLTSSRSDAKQQVKAGALSINNKRVSGNESLRDFLVDYEDMLILRKGKKNYHVLRCV
jgi:tyrosyl-tRNA synthetase